jgi:hypothetical protein
MFTLHSSQSNRKRQRHGTRLSLEALETRSLLSAALPAAQTWHAAAIHRSVSIAHVAYLDGKSTAAAMRQGASAKITLAAPITAAFKPGQYVAVYKPNLAVFLTKVDKEIQAYIKSQGWKGKWVPNTPSVNLDKSDIHITIKSLGHDFKTKAPLDKAIAQRQAHLSQMVPASLNYRGSHLQINAGDPNLAYLVYDLGTQDQQTLRAMTGLKGKDFHITVGHMNKTNPYVKQHLEKISDDLFFTGFGAIPKTAPGKLNAVHITHVDNINAKYPTYREIK